MKKKYFILLFVFGFSISLNSQPYNYKWVGPDVGDYLVTSNWYNVDLSINGIPAANDNIIFDDGNTITVQNIPNSLSLGILDIKNSTDVEFQSSLNITIIYTEVKIEEGSSYNVTQINFAVNLKCADASISGTVRLDGANHSIEPILASSKLEFLPNSSFISGETLGALPFGNIGGEVIFHNNSSYRHFGGGSPFSGTNIVTFEPESYYYIKGGDGSNEIFSGKTYGHIIIDLPDASDDIQVQSSGGAASVFTCNIITCISGNITFEGSESDTIQINKGIELVDGNISLHGHSFSFHNAAFVNSQNSNNLIEFIIKGNSATSFNMLSLNDTLMLNSNLSIKSNVLGINHNIIISGTINCTNKTLMLSDVKLTLNGKLITAHYNGFEGSIDGMVEYNNNTIFEYNGTSIQSAGFANYYTAPIGKMIINNNNHVILDSDIEVTNLQLNQGKLILDNTILNLSGNGNVISSSDSYVITEGTGFISSSVPVGTDFIFPVGTFISYAPVIINSSIANTFSISVNDTVFSNGDYGEELLYEDLINHTWKIEASDAASSITSLSLGWEAVSQGSTFNSANSQLAYYDSSINEWDFSSFTAASVTAGTLVVSNIDKYGYFIISSHQNDLPESADNQVSTDLLTDYVFKESDFPITDNNGDALVKLLIENSVTGGELYLDKDGNGTFSTDEIISVSTEVFITDIRDSKFIYHPIEEGLFAFKFKISDGFNYSLLPAQLSIVVSINLVNDTIFYIPERSPKGTLVGQIQPITAGDVLSFEVLSRDDDNAFEILRNGVVNVLNPDLLIKAVNPEFNYRIKANNSDSESDEFNLKIILKDALPVNLLITNYISPNDDGVNDTWIVRGIESGTYSVAIFDARGNKVFQSDNYLNEWNGTMNGTILNSGVYYYIVRSPNIEKKGTITLVR